MTLHFSLRRWTGVAVALGCLLSAPAFAADKKPDPQAELNAASQARMLNLEQMIESLTGQIEELRFKNTQQGKQLQQLQDDLSLRVSALEQAAGGRPAVAAPAAVAPGVAAPAPLAQAPARAPRGAEGYGPVDLTAPASAPVAKQPEAMPLQKAEAPVNALPNTPEAAPATDNGFNIRVDANGKALPPDPNQKYTPPPAAAAPVAPPRINAAPAPGAVGAGGISSSSNVNVQLPDGPPKQQYDFATALLRQQDYAKAEVALREFVKRNPKDPLAANAQYWLGESFYARGDYSQAAVEFMGVYQNYRTSPKAPDSLLKVGMSLEAMRQTAPACTAYGNIAREYPNADDRVRKDAQAARTKLKCT